MEVDINQIRLEEVGIGLPFLDHLQTQTEVEDTYHLVEGIDLEVGEIILVVEDTFLTEEENLAISYLQLLLSLHLSSIRYFQRYHPASQVNEDRI